MEWIDISQQAPEFEVPILVSGDGKILIARLVAQVTSKGSTSFEFQSGESGYDDLWIAPTHWMPLPEPASSKQ